MTSFPPKEIAQSRQEALETICAILRDPEKLKEAESRKISSHYGKDKFLVTWKANYHGMPCEERIDICDSGYRAYSGRKAVHVSVGLFHERQIGDGFLSVEVALLKVGLKLCATLALKQEFFNEFCKPFNERLKENTNA